MAERHDHRSSDEIRHDIEGTRAEFRETVDALERKLSLGQIIDEVWGRVGGRGTAGAAVSSVGDTIRDNPVPLALMGLGVAWLAVDKATDSGSESDTDRRAPGRVGPYRGAAVHESGPSSMDKAKHKASEAVGQAKEKASAVASKAKGLASDARRKASDATDSLGSSNGEASGNGDSHAWYEDAEGNGLSDRAGGMADRAHDVADRAREGARRGAEKAKRGLSSAMDEQPLALGAVAFGLGLASGLAVPTTRWEDRTMGKAADAVKEEAGSLAKGASSDVKRVVESATSAAKDEANRQTGQLKVAASSVASEAKQAATREMHDRDLDAEGMKDRANEFRERTKDRLND